MSLEPGSRLGAYEIVALIGAGGMGEVYRARDTRLKREVAIKILPDAFANDADRLARFQREAEVLATLNHPNIAQIFGVEDRAIVLELVDGPTLADRIAQGPIPLDEALPVAKQIVEALGAAHERSVIHRDLKPANIKLTPDGKVKILDFGLAKSLDRTDAGRNVRSAGAGPPGQDPAYLLSQSPTLTSPMMTGGGIILGTAAYMSPEQAKGKAVDKRTDIWAFGCVLFEMLTGRRAFEGEDVSDTMAAILRAEPDWRLIPKGVPEYLGVLLRQCLEKDRTRRIVDFSVVEFLLGNQLRLPGTADASIPAPTTRRWQTAALVAVVGVTALVVGASLTWRPTPTLQPRVVRFTYQLPEGQQFTGGARRAVAISNDGLQIAFVANQRLYLKSMWESEAKEIPGTNVAYLANGVVLPTFSPDGRSLVFWTAADSTFKKIATTGGPAITLFPATSPMSLIWDGDTILFSELGRGILRVPANGGTPEVIIPARNNEIAIGGELLPDRKTLLYTRGNGALPDLETNGEVIVQQAGSADGKTLVRAGYARYLPTGHILYHNNGVLFAVRFDLERLALVGSPVPIIEGVRRGGNASGGAPHFSVSATGDIVYIPGPVTSGTSRQLGLAWLDQRGVLERLTLPVRAYDFPRVSPDGRLLAVGIDDGREADIWVYEVSRSSSIRRLTFGGSNRFPVWNADSRRLAFQSDREGDAGIFWQPADGSGIAERLTKADKQTSHVPYDLSSDGRTLLFAIQERDTQTLWTMSLGDHKITRFDQVQSAQPTPINAAFSRDGRWIAYSSNESRRDVVYVQPFPATGARYEIGPGRNPFWSPSGDTLYISAGPQPSFFAVNVSTKPSFSFSPPRSIPRPAAQLRQTMPRNYDIARDGSRFVIVVAADDSAIGTSTERLQVVLNWFEELKQRVPVRD